MAFQKTLEKFIEESKAINGNKYDYSLTEYKGAGVKVKIICPIHGVFEVQPNNHLKRGDACQKCGWHNLLKNSNEKIINKFKKIHGEKYNYSKIEYINNSSKLIILCPQHGKFNQSFNSHSAGHGCPSCGVNSRIILNSSNSKEFIDKANIIHFNKYDYSKINYINNYSKIEIICPKHGSFKQQPSIHLSDHGCPKCKQSKGERSIAVYLENKKIPYLQEHKFFDCINPNTKHKLRFDFWLPKQNTIIEYDGRQHFFSSKYFGEKSFEHTQYTDKLKNEYCYNNNIRLIRIKYNQAKDQQKSIFNTLDSFFTQ